MSVIAFHEAAAAAARPVLSLRDGRRWLCRSGLNAIFVLAGLGLFASTPAIAQYNGGGTYGRSVIVNPEVLNNLGAGGGVGGLPYRPGSQAIYNPTVPYTPYGQSPQAGFPVARPGTLLFPPHQRPLSQVLTQSQPLYQSQYQNPYAAAPSAQGYIPPQPNVTDQARSQLLVPSPSPSSTPSVASTVTQLPAAPAIPQATVAQPVAVETTVPAAPAPVPAAAPEPPPVQETTLAAVPQAPASSASIPEAPAAPAETEQVQTLAAQPETALPAAVAAPSPPAEVATATVSPPAEPAAEELPPPPEVEAAEVPAAPAAPAAETAEPAPLTAALTPATDEALAARVLFGEGSADLTADGKAELQSLAQSLNEDESLRVQLLAFASGDGDEANAARRLSLSRALVVRGFLIDQGIPSTRMQVRALGNKYESGPPDRVDIHPQNS